MLVAVAAARRAAGARRQGPAAPLQLEQLHRAGDGQALRGVLQVRGRADLLLGQRGAARQARRRRQGLRRPGADRQRRAGADQGQPAEAARQGAAAQPQERRSAVPEHQVRPGQQVLGAVRDVDHDHRLQRREDEGARPARPTPGRSSSIPSTWPRSRAASRCSTARTSSSPPRSSTWATRPTTPTRSTGRRRPTSSRRPSPTGRRSTRRRTSRS